MVAVNNRFCFVLNASLRLSNAYSGVVMTRVVLCVALLPLLLTPERRRRRMILGRMHRGSSISWSPSFCAGAAERGAGTVARNVQCGPRPYSFVVHGLWPQYDNGFPEYCQIPAPRLDHGVVSSMLDLMPAPRLIFNEWDRHGTCSGHSPRAYFETVRKARAAVKIPPEFTDLKEPLSVTPHAVEEAFINANPGLSASAMAVGCDAKRLTEVRLCLSKDLQFRDCRKLPSATAGESSRSCRRCAAAKSEGCSLRQKQSKSGQNVPDRDVR